METIELALITSIITNIVVVYVSYIKTYRSEKGKNLATKEDIEEITQKVESVKNEISLSKQRIHNYLLERKFNIVSFLEIASEYETNILRVEIGFNLINTQEYYLNIQEELFENRKKLYKTLLLINIYSNDQQTNEKANNLYISISKLYTYLININLQLNNYSMYRHEYKEKATTSNKLINYIEEIDDKVNSLSKSFKEEIKIYTDDIDGNISEYRILIWLLYKLNFHQKIKFGQKSEDSKD